MGLKSVFENMKQKDSLLVKDLDDWLSKNRGGQDRRFDINSPSCAGRCARANYYGRVLLNEVQIIDPRLRRIFENGDGVHDRLQGYFEKMGRLLMREVPLIDDDYEIQGHSDGLITFGQKLKELAVLELKSINDNGFKSLKEPKPEHKKQAMVYLNCAEKRRVWIHETYPTLEEYKASKPERIRWYKAHYTHLKDGSKYTKKQKLMKKIKDHLLADDILYSLDRPLDTVIFMYENKNTQELKEFPVKYSATLVEEVLDEYADLNDCVIKRKPPKREGTKSCFQCMHCDWKYECWN